MRAFDLRISIYFIVLFLTQKLTTKNIEANIIKYKKSLLIYQTLRIKNTIYEKIRKIVKKDKSGCIRLQNL